MLGIFCVRAVGGIGCKQGVENIRVGILCVEMAVCQLLVGRFVGIGLVEMGEHEKYSTMSSNYIGFYLYFCTHKLCVYSFANTKKYEDNLWHERPIALNCGQRLKWS